MQLFSKLKLLSNNIKCKNRVKKETKKAKRDNKND